MSDNNDPFVDSNKELEKRLQTVRSRLRRLKDIDEELEFTEDEEAEFAYMREVIKLIISNGTMDSCVAEDNSTTFSTALDDLIENLYDISSALYYVRNCILLITMIF